MCQGCQLPRYEHDCSECAYLGQHGESDLYFCQQMLGGPTVIARYSSEGPDYSSGLEFAKLGLNSSLVVAYERAKERGLVE